MTEMMRAVQLTGYGDNSHLRLSRVRQPLPGPMEVLIKVHYAGLNPVDFKTRRGMLRPVLPLELPAIAGNEVAGEIVEVGQGTRDFEVGQWVHARLDKTRMGAFAEYVATAADLVAPVPQGMPLEVAAGVPLVALTAWQALFEYGAVSEGDHVLIHAGAGAVGRVAIQLARQLGAHVYTTVSSRGEALARERGAETVINYRQERFEEIAQDMDFVLDTVGGRTLRRSFKTVKRGGKVCSLSAVPEPRTANDLGAGQGLRLLFWVLSLPTRLLARRYGADYRFLFMRADGELLKQIGKEYESGHLTFDIDKVYPLESYAKAYDDLEHGRAFGKLVLKVISE